METFIVVKLLMGKNKASALKSVAENFFLVIDRMIEELGMDIQ